MKLAFVQSSSAFCGRAGNPIAPTQITTAAIFAAADIFIEHMALQLLNGAAGHFRAQVGDELVERARAQIALARWRTETVPASASLPPTTSM